MTQSSRPDRKARTQIAVTASEMVQACRGYSLENSVRIYFDRKLRIEALDFDDLIAVEAPSTF